MFITWKIASRVERKSEKSKRACSSIRDFRVPHLENPQMLIKFMTDGSAHSVYFDTWSAVSTSPIIDLFLGSGNHSTHDHSPCLQLQNVT